MSKPAEEPRTAELVPVSVLDWTVFTAEGAYWIRDLDLAERAGLKKPHDIRNTIKGALEDGALSDVSRNPLQNEDGIGPGATGANKKRESKPLQSALVRVEIESSKTGKGRKQTATVYYLNEEAALLVVMRLRTEKAAALTRDVVRVFLAVAQAVRDGSVEARVALAGLGLSAPVPALEAPGLTTRAVLVTPEMAAEWMTHRNEKNRRIRESLVDRYAADMKRGNWKTTHQGIAFGPDGELIDGQHRLAGVIQAGVPVMMHVTNYSSATDAEAAKLKCDTGRSKSMGDVFSMIGLSGNRDGDRLAAVVKGMRTIDGYRSDTMSPDEVRASYILDRVSVDWAISTLNAREFSALHRAAFAYAHSVFPTEIEAFAELVKNVDAPAGTPASTYLKAHMAGHLRQTAGFGRREVTLKILRLLKAHVKGEGGLSKLYATTDGLDFFRSRRAAAAEVKTPTKADELLEALTLQGFPRLRVKRAIKVLGERVETESLDELTRAALQVQHAGRHGHGARRVRDRQHGGPQAHPVQVNLRRTLPL